MASRRTFLKRAAALAAGALSVVPSRGAGPAAAREPSANPPKERAPAGVSTGQVPDTLELAERGRLALGGMLGSLDPAVGYECYFLAFFDVHPAYMVHFSSMVSGVMPKYVEALPMLRLMSGSRNGAGLQSGFMDAMLKNMADDGLVYDRTQANRPWNTGVQYGVQHWDEDYANMAGNGRLLAGLTYWLQWTGDAKWKTLARKTAERMLKLAIVRGEVAYYPNPGLGNDFSYPRQSGWTNTDPPKGPAEGFEGSTLFYLWQPLRGFVRYYALTGDERFLKLSRKFVNLGMEPKFWGSTDDVYRAAGTQHGHFQGHYHGTLAALRSLLDYALAADDNRLKLFARDAYDWARQNGISRLGLFNGSGNTEGCTIADMVGLAVALSDAGLGDYWDDVEQYVRNGLVEAQFNNRDEMVRASEAGPSRPKDSRFGAIYDGRFDPGNAARVDLKRPILKGQECADHVIERCLGTFGPVKGARYLLMTENCCTANGAQALYYAWEAIVRARGDTAEVNLWLNRRSPWCDVWSWLPYTGKLVVQNKGMRRLLIRKPGWARQTAIRCRLDGRDVQPAWLGNRIVLDGLRGNERVELQVPLAVEKAEYGLIDLNARHQPFESYACEFKGHTAVRVTPVGSLSDRPWCRIFLRDAMRGDKAPMKPSPQYVHPARLVRWMAP